ncbi:MAG: SUMF1/EgtB/PvdO family nonheme iron enzyme [Polyangiaceae bacterium]
MAAGSLRFRGLQIGVYGLVLGASVAASVAMMVPRLLHPHVDLRRMPRPPEILLTAPEPTPSAPTPGAVAERPPEEVLDQPLCPRDMALVHGMFCPFVAHQCAKSRKSGTCDEFKPEVLCEGTIRESRFCIDRYEYPNEVGAKPVVLVDFEDAKRACDNEGKRLCTVDEWQFACEGTAMLPLPSGVRRDGGCVVDRADPTSLLGAAKSSFEYAAAVMHVDGREPSAPRPGCESAWGAFDLVGNVGEWAVNPSGSLTAKPFHSAVLGGSFGSGEAKCRTADFSAADSSTSHRVGFRCCVDAGPRPNGELALPSRRSPGGFRPIKMPSSR